MLPASPPRATKTAPGPLDFTSGTGQGTRQTREPTAGWRACLSSPNHLVLRTANFDACNVLPPLHTRGLCGHHFHIDAVLEGRSQVSRQRGSRHLFATTGILARPQRREICDTLAFGFGAQRRNGVGG